MQEESGRLGSACPGREKKPRISRSEVEDRLCRLAGEVLDLGPLGNEEDFFVAGGDSLSGLELVVRLEDELGIAMELEDLLDNGQIIKLVSVVMEHLERESSDL
jgi:acyl carrier protein